ncbi:unnamed protein product, partial [marine sediment metagenome]
YSRESSRYDIQPDGTEKTDQCLQRPINIETHAQGMKADFIYGDWVLTQDESLEIDPDTVTLSDPTEAGRIHWIFEPSSYSRGGVPYMGWYGTYAYRGYAEWDISSIPDSATILDTVFKYHGLRHDANSDCHIHEMLGCQPSEQPSTNIGNEAVWDEIGEGTVYVDPAGFPVVATNQEVDLGTTADSHLQSQLANDWFAIGFQLDTESPTRLAQIYTWQYGRNIYLHSTD